MRCSGVSKLALPATLALLLLCVTGTIAQTFPCPSTDSNAGSVPGGYQNVQRRDLSRADIISVAQAANASFTQWLDQDANFTLCNETNTAGIVDIGIVQVCRQVVAGTNWGIKMVVNYECQVDSDTAAEDQVVLNAVVFVPLASNASNAAPTPQVTSVWRDPNYPVEELEIDEVAPPPSDYLDYNDDDGSPAGPSQSPTSSLWSFGSLNGL